MPRSALQWRYDWRFFESDLRALFLVLGAVYGWVLLVIVTTVAIIVLVID